MSSGAIHLKRALAYATCCGVTIAFLPQRHRVTLTEADVTCRECKKNRGLAPLNRP